MKADPALVNAARSLSSARNRPSRWEQRQSKTLSEKLASFMGQVTNGTEMSPRGRLHSRRPP